MNKIIDGKEISKDIKKELKDKISLLKNKPCLVVISVGNNEASKVYVRQKEKAANLVGITYQHLHYDEIKEEDLLKEIDKLNKDSNVNGVIVQLPLPDYLNSTRIVNYIDSSKDVDGLSYLNAGKLLNNSDCLVSCTPNGIMELLKRKKVDLVGKKVVVIGRSILVGKPMMNLFINANSTVTLCHSKTKDIASYTKHADIIVVAIGKPNFLKKEMIKKGVILIDVGINRVGDSLIGDIDYNDCYPKAKLITPVPGGVGPMTVAMLMSNVYEAYLKQNN